MKVLISGGASSFYRTKAQIRKLIITQAIVPPLKCLDTLLGVPNLQGIHNCSVEDFRLDSTPSERPST